MTAEQDGLLKSAIAAELLRQRATGAFDGLCLDLFAPGVTWTFVARNGHEAVVLTNDDDPKAVAEKVLAGQRCKTRETLVTNAS